MERHREYAPTSLGARDYKHNVESSDVPYAYVFPIIVSIDHI